jgi:integrase
MKLSAITPDVIRNWRNKLLKKKKTRGNDCISKTTINHAFSIISTVFNTFSPHMSNPCSEVPKFKEQKLNTFLKSTELQQFFTTLDAPDTPEYIRDYLLLSLYTGARRSNVLAMRWGHIDLNLKLWLVPSNETKNQEQMVIPLLDQAVKILQRRKSKATSIFVFPSPKSSKTGHLMEPKRSWKNLSKRAGLSPTYRLHDLRRTMGSWQAITGSSTKIIGASLGHKSESATAHYAHLTIEPVRAAMQKAADAMDEQKELEKIVKL